jgi:hypothetical protein
LLQKASTEIKYTPTIYSMKTFNMEGILERFDKDHIWTTLNPRVSRDSFSSVVVFLISLMILTIVDFFFFTRFEKVGGTNARWFALHAFANLFVVILSIPDVIQTIVDPANSMSIQCEFSSIACTDAPVCIIAAIHLYHILAFRNLTWDDWFHHLLFAVGICSLHFCFKWGPVSQFLSFFISGLPGGIDYAMLSGVKLKVLRPITEKRINRFMNVWIRSPGLMTSGVLAYASYRNGHNHINPSALLFGMVLVVFNGQYYMERVVANHAVKKYAYKQTVAIQANLTQVEEIRSTSGMHKIASFENLQNIAAKSKNIIRNFSNSNLKDMDKKSM